MDGSLIRFFTPNPGPPPVQRPVEYRVDLAVVLPTYNERENIAEIIARLEDALQGLCWEAIFVDDDSPDGTAELIGAFARRDRRVRLLHRVSRRGLSSACIEVDQKNAFHS